MGKKKSKKNKHKKKKWLSLQNVLQGKPHTPYYSQYLLPTFYCSTCNFFLANKKDESWHNCPNCQSANCLQSIGKKDMSAYL